jgi:hypothetical protein
VETFRSSFKTIWGIDLKHNILSWQGFTQENKYRTLYDLSISRIRATATYATPAAIMNHIYYLLDYE